MLSKSLRLLCCTLVLSLTQSVYGQATATGSENGIVSAAGGPEATQSVSYSIIGGGDIPSATSSGGSMTNAVEATATDATVMNESSSSSTDGGSISIPAILGITLAVVFSIVGVIIIVMFVHRRRTQSLNRAKRKSIMDAEFAASKYDLRPVMTEQSNFSNSSNTTNHNNNTNLGYFDLAKPLPAVIDKDQPARPIEGDRLSRSSTIIADAAEIAQINRKASTHQARRKKSREQQRERNQALQILITNADNDTHPLPQSPFSANATTPINSQPNSPRDICPDGNGDPFATRQSKI